MKRIKRTAKDNVSMRVLLDTNFLIDAVRFKIDLEELTDLIGKPETATLSSVKKELTRISQGKTKVGGYAKAALEFIEKNNVRIVPSNERPDTAMPKLAGENTIIATNDTELRKRLKALGKKTIYLKGKKHLAIG